MSEKVKWLEEKEFEEIVCIKDSNYCTSCGRCQNEEEAI